MLGYKDEDGTSSEHIQSRYQMEEHPPMTLVDQVLKTTVANEPDILSHQQQAPAAKNTQGFQSMQNEFTGGQPFDYESLFNDPDGFFSINAPGLSPFHIDHGEYGFSSDGIFL